MMISAAGTMAAVAANPLLWAAPLVQTGRVFDPRHYGAKGDGVALDTQPIQSAIDECTSLGGGTVLLAPGTYVTGLVRLKSNVTFQLQAGAKILASPKYSDFALPADAVAITKVSVGAHLIFALNAENITLLGPGIIDGNSPSYMVAKGRPPVAPENEYRDVAAFDTQRVHPISPMVELGNVTNLRVENITLQNSVGWALRPIGCSKVLIRKVTVRNPLDASNTDGIDPQACLDAVIDDCDIITGDDAICVKSGNFYGGNQITRNIQITNCRVSTCTNGLKVGVEGPRPFQDIHFSNCEVYGGSGPVNQRPISGVAVEMADGSSIEGVTFDKIRMTNVRTPIFIRLQVGAGSMKYAQANHSPLKGSIQNVSISNVRATGAILTSSITGLDTLVARDIHLRDISITTSEPGTLAFTQSAVREAATSYMEANMFGRLPAYGLYARHVEGLTLENVSIHSQTADPRPMLACDDVKQLSVEGVSGTAADPTQPFIDLRDTQSARIKGSHAPVGTGVFVKVSGAGSHDVQLRGNDLRESKNPVMRGSNVPDDGIGSVN